MLSASPLSTSFLSFPHSHPHPHLSHFCTSPSPLHLHLVHVNRSQERSPSRSSSQPQQLQPQPQQQQQPQPDLISPKTCACFPAIWADWADMQTAGMVLMGYAAFGVIICLTNGPWALKAHTDRYTRLHPLVHVLGIVPPMVGGLVCKPFIM
jgi:hypothetical protein